MSVHDRLGGRLSVPDWLGERVGHFPRNQEELEVHGFPMSLYFVGMLRLIGWNQGRLAINQYGEHSFPNGVQKG